MQNPNTRVPARLAGNMGISQKTYGIEKVQTYQNITTVTKMDMSINNSARKSRKKNQGTTRTKITKKIAIIVK